MVHETESPLPCQGYVPVETTDNHTTTTESPLPRQGYIPVETTDIDTTANNSTTTTTITKTTDSTTNNSTTTLTIVDPANDTNATVTYETPYRAGLERPPSYWQPVPTPKKQDDCCGVVMFLILLLGPIVLLGWLRHKTSAAYEADLKYNPKIHVQSASFSLYNLTSSRITTEGEITLNVTKPVDDYVFLYDETVVSILYWQDRLSATTIESFAQNEAGQTTVKAIFPRKISLIETWVSERIAKDLNSSSVREFSLYVEAKGRLWRNRWTGAEDLENGRWMSFTCPNVTIEIVAKTGEGKKAGEPSECHVRTEEE